MKIVTNRNRLLGVLLATLLPLIGLAATLRPFQARAATPQVAQIRLHSSTAQELHFTLHTPPATLRGEQVSVAGLDDAIQTPGAPQMPTYAAYVAVPPGAAVSVSAAATSVTRRTVKEVRPAPGADAAQLDLDAFGSRPPLSPMHEMDPAVYTRDALYPAHAFTHTAPLYYRDWRLVRLTLHPIRYNPVARQMQQAEELEVTITFSGADLSLAHSDTADSALDGALETAVLNYEQGRNWRHWPQAVEDAAPTPLPTGTDVYKISVREEGIYDVSGAALAAQGMNIASVNPASIEMMSGGEPVAYRFVGDGDDALEANELIRFYGRPFTGSRLKTQFAESNVYWLWADGSPSTIATAPNEAGQGHPVATDFPESITWDDVEQYHYHTRTDQWPTFPNEPDAWYIDLIQKSSAAPLTTTYPITLLHPAPAGPDVTWLVEIMTRDTPVIDDQVQDHVGRVYLNDFSGYVEQTWEAAVNLNLTATAPITALNPITNEVHFVSLTEAVSGSPERLYTNRITVDYQRQLRAINNELVFGWPISGSHEFRVAGFTAGDPAQALVWDISDPRQPVQIGMENFISNTGSTTYTWRIGRSHGAEARFIAATISNTRSPQIEQYVAPDLDPASGGADWIAISHADFLSQANQLAAHRADNTYTGLSTHVVDVADVINQYGYGLPLPDAIHNYLGYALANWDPAPRYVLLVGDANFNPLHRDCVSRCVSDFDKDEPIYVLTDLIFKDRYQGLIPSDHTMVMLSGDDPVADMAIGRIPAQTTAEATAIINKIILYEEIGVNPPLTNTFPLSITFVADDPDDAGNFCQENEDVIAHIPSSFNVSNLCMETPDATEVQAVRAAMFQHVSNNDGGLSILNYRGHGSVRRWTKPPDENTPPLLTASITDTIDFWRNEDRPVVILSADCLDGYFTYPGYPGMGETFLKYDAPGLFTLGTAAHWAATGLGLTGEHTILHAGLYDGVFRENLTALGDAILYSKLNYFQGGHHPSELYSFTLIGDPAMPLYRPELSLELRSGKLTAEPGDSVLFYLDLANNDGLHLAQPRTRVTLPPHLEFTGVSSNHTVTHTITAEGVSVKLEESIAPGEEAALTLNLRVGDGAPAGPLTATAVLDNPSYDLNPGNEQDSAAVDIFGIQYDLFLPAIQNR